MQVNDASLIQVLAGSLLGLFGGVGATALWEGLIKPRRDRRNLARSLATEIRVNKSRIERAVAARREDQIPFNLRLSTLVFESVAERLAELPEELLPDLVLMYHRCESINRLAAYALELSDRLRSSGSSAKTEADSDLDRVLDGLDHGIQNAAADIDELLPKLVRYSRFTSEAWLPLVYQDHV